MRTGFLLSRLRYRHGAGGCNSRAGSADPRAIRDALAETKDLEVVTGMLSMDENRNPIKSVAVLKVTPEKQEFVATVHP